VSTSSKASFGACFTKKVKEQQPEGRGQLWASGQLCELTASGELLGEGKANDAMPHLTAPRRCPMLMAAEMTWFSYFILKCDRLVDLPATSGKARYLPEGPLTSCALPLCSEKITPRLFFH